MRVLGATLAAFFVLASTAVAAPHSCSRPGSKTLMETRHVRVYQWYDRSRTVDAVSACMYSVGKAWEIGNVWEYATSYSRVRLDALRRQYLAYSAVDVNSLVLRRGRVDWLHDGEPRSAPLR